MMRILLTFLLLLLGVAEAAILPTVRGTITTQNLNATGTCTAGSCVEYGVETAGTITVQVTGTYTGALSIQVTTDGATWVTLGAGDAVTRMSTGVQAAAIPSGATDVFRISAPGVQRIRVTGLAAMTGTANVAIRAVETGGGGGSTGGGGGAVTVGDGSDAGLGATTDVAATPGGTGSVNSKLRALTAQLPTSLGIKGPSAALPVVLPDALAVSGTCAAACAGTNLFSQDMSGYSSITVQVTSAGTATITYETSDDNTNWVVAQGTNVSTGATVTTSTATGVFQFGRKSKFFRARISAYTSGTVTVAGNLSHGGASGAGGGSGGAVTISDGVDVATGSTTDVAATAGGTGTVSSKLRLMTTQLGTIDTSINATNPQLTSLEAAVNATNTQLPASLGVKTEAASLSVVVANSGTSVPVTASFTGQTAHDSAITGNPVRIGARARTTNVTAVASDDAVDLVSSTVGQLIVKPYQIPDQDWKYAAPNGGSITNSTAEIDVKTAAGVGLKNFITGLCVSTTTLSGATELVLKEAAAATVIFRMVLNPVALDMRCVTFPSPLATLSNSPLKAATITAVTGSVYLSAQGYVAP